VYYESESSSEEEVVYRKKKKQPKEIEVKEEPKVEPKAESLSDEVIKRQFNKELDDARIKEMVSFFKPTTNWKR